MGGKKKGKKGKKGKKKAGGIADDATVEEKNFILQAEKESLEQRLILTLQQANDSKRKEQEKRAREQKLNEMMEANQKRTHDIIADMTRQFKSTEDELMRQQTMLQQRKEQNEVTIEQLEQELKEVKDSKAALKAEKDKDMENLNNYIQQMSSNFSSMLKATLAKMKERINQANKTWELENDTRMLEKFKEIVDNG